MEQEIGSGGPRELEEDEEAKRRMESEGGGEVEIEGPADPSDAPARTRPRQPGARP